VSTAGKTCYTEPVPGDGTFTLTGSGTGLSGNGDQYQFNYTTLETDRDFVARVASQDLVPASNQAGIMMRDSLTDISRFIFIKPAITDCFIYRTTPGGGAVSSFTANSVNANFFRILKQEILYRFYETVNQTLGTGGTATPDGSNRSTSEWRCPVPLQRQHHRSVQRF
jgi:hypothetical protein